MLSDALPARLTPPVVENVEAIAARHRALYWTVPAVNLVQPVLAHLGLSVDLLRTPTSPPDLRRRTGIVAAETALLAGRILFFDLRREADARGCLRTALELALDAGDHELAAAIFGHMAFIPGFAGDLSEARDHLRGADVNARHGAAHNIQAWLAAAESEVCARARDVPSSLAAVLRAEEKYSGIAEPGEPPWFDWFSSELLASFAGYAHLRAGDLQSARERLTSALSTLPADKVKQRAVLLADLASVVVGDERPEIDEACRLLTDALSSLSATAYATGFERVREVRHRLEGWREEPAVRRLDEVLYG
jgi:tetratricopeptide (TPR) repeat protein